MVPCATYGRKSDEKGLEQRFNSIDYQHDSGANYIALHQHLNWVQVGRYEDAAISGGTMERPGLQKLLHDVKCGAVKVIVVYKIDRLSRSLADFAVIAKMLDEHGASFVSVTEKFDTSTAMGKLHLNMILSFAQFERELASERIRDKAAATKRKGMWMGGRSPLGYDLIDKALHINPVEAETVRFIFTEFAKTRSITKIAAHLQQEDIRTKRYVSKQGLVSGDKPFCPRLVRDMLLNPVYNGKIRHVRLNKVYDGQHDAIIDDALWQRVQEIFEANPKGSRLEPKQAGLLAGIAECHDCQSSMTHVHTRKKNKLYTYYICNAHAKKLCYTCSVKRIPAQIIERVVLDKLAEILKSPKLIYRVWQLVKAQAPDEFTEGDVYDAMRKLGCSLESLFPEQQRQIVQLTVQKVQVSRDKILIQLLPNGLEAVFRNTRGQPSTLRDAKQEPMLLEVPIQWQSWRGQTTIIAGKGKPKASLMDRVLIRHINQAFEWNEQILQGKYKSIRHLAMHERYDEAYIRRIIKLRFLAPDILEKIAVGDMPTKLSMRKMTDGFTSDWQEQREKFGF